jgi:hypothetical protein
MKPRERGGIVDSRLNVYGVQGLKRTLRVRPTGTARASNDVRPVRAPPITYCTYLLPFREFNSTYSSPSPSNSHRAFLGPVYADSEKHWPSSTYLPARLAQAVHKRGAFRSEVVFLRHFVTCLRLRIAYSKREHRASATLLTFSPLPKSGSSPSHIYMQRHGFHVACRHLAP